MPTPFRNRALKNHPLLATRQVFLPPGCTPHPSAGKPLPLGDSETIARHGDEVIIAAVFEDWNGVRGLTMCYVFVPVTLHHTHLLPAEMGLF